MQKNMGRVDRTIRLVAALVIAGLTIAGVLKGTVAVVLMIVAATLVLTTLIGFCPVYAPFKASTKEGPDGGTTRSGD